VDSRAALNASSAWAGLGLISVVILYIRLRNANADEKTWGSAKIGISLLAVSGLDILPTMILIVGVGHIYGTVESWNSQMEIPTWISTVLWAPHHIAALIAGLCAVMLVLSARGKPAQQKFILLCIAGMAFASSVGLSLWVTLLFVVFWGTWIVVLIIQKAEHSLVLSMVACGILAIILASPFIFGLLKTGSDGGTGQSPIIFDIRTLYLLEILMADWTPIYRSLLMLALLPINYFLELGFFLAAGFYWLKTRNKIMICSNPFYIAETVLMIIVVLIGSSLRSTIANNDLGWRVWLPGQFILLIWGVDIIEILLPRSETATTMIVNSTKIKKQKKFLYTLIFLGILTSSMDALFLRITLPFRVDPETGNQNYSARLAYDFLRDHIPARIITQNNPLIPFDRPSGLYGTHQMIISDRTGYGVPLNEYSRLVNELKILFTNKKFIDWKFIDIICQKYYVDLLIFNDTDPIWDSLPILKLQRPSLYENNHYSLFACGEYAKSSNINLEYTK
jgi:hypothetical protein